MLLAKQEHSSCFQGSNLCVTNLEAMVGEEQLRDEFSKFGNVTCAKVIRDKSGQSKDFGFACYPLHEEATMAMSEMNGKPILSRIQGGSLHFPSGM